jgi:hypothetical protein
MNSQNHVANPGKTRQLCAMPKSRMWLVRLLRKLSNDPGLLFKDLLVKEDIVGLLGKLAYESFEIFYSEPMLVINPAIYPPISVEKSLGPAISLLFFLLYFFFL